MPMIDTILDICTEAVRTHAKGSDATAEEVAACFKITIPGTVQATIDAVAAGKWKPPAGCRRRNRLAAASAEPAKKDPPADPPKK